VIVLAKAMDLGPAAVGPGPVLAGCPTRRAARPGAPRAHMSHRHVTMPRVSTAVMTSPQVIPTDASRMALVPPRPQRAAHRRRRPLDGWALCGPGLASHTPRVVLQLQAAVSSVADTSIVAPAASLHSRTRPLLMRSATVARIS
jgi:hypothetical protein